MSNVRVLVIVIVIFSVLTWLIGSFLGVDDLASCGDAPSEQSGCQTAGAVVAVSGGDTLARADEAIRLYKAGWAQKLVFSGAALDKSGPSNAEVMRQYAVKAGVPDGVIITEETSENTKENAHKTAGLFSDKQITDIIVVTSPYHERRAVMEFRQRSPQLVVRGHPTPNDKYWPTWWWVTPNGWYLAMSELMKTILVYTSGSRA